jgi:hypothetical protein
MVLFGFGVEVTFDPPVKCVLAATEILLANSPNKELMRFIRPNLKILRG